MANMPTLLRSAGNNIQQTLNGAIANDTTTTMVLTDASTCSADGGLLEIDYDSPTLREVVYYNSKSTHTLTIADNGRGLYGTTAQSHLDGALVRGFFVDSHINNLVDAASTHTTASSTTTFTNKTIDANGTGNSITNLEVADFTAAAVVTETDTIAANDNDTTIPTSAAVKAYADRFSGCSLYQGSAQTLTTSAITTILWSNEHYDTDSYHNTSTNTERITVPITGYYHFRAGLQFPSNNAGERRLWLEVDGDTTQRLFYHIHQASATIDGLELSGTLYLAANSYVLVRGYQTSGGDLDTNASSANGTNFQCTYMGS